MVAMTHLKHGDVSQGPGRWDRINQGLWMSCPDCGQIGLFEDYLIRVDGVVEHTVICEFNCGFKDFLALEGWIDSPEIGQ